MARVHLTPGRDDGADLGRLRRAAGVDRFRRHELVDDAREAEIVIFTDPASPNMTEIRRHPLYRQHPQKCFVMTAGDRVLPFVPGIFVCAEEATHPRHRSRTGGYLRVTLDKADDAFDPAVAVDARDELLFSFVGRTETAPVRRRLANLRHDRAVVIDASKPGRALPRDEFDQILRRSRFVLCPRGYGSSSFRLFETLRAGRVPVIVSDAWVPCDGPNWQSCSIQVPEDGVDAIPRVLENAEDRYGQLRAGACQVWADWFAPDVVFHRTVEWCLDLESHQPASRLWDDFAFRLGRFRPSMLYWSWTTRHWRRQLRTAA